MIFWNASGRENKPVQLMLVILVMSQDLDNSVC